MIKVVNIAAK